MTKKCDLCVFLKNPNPKTEVLVTKHWNVGVSNDHPYLGRAFVSLRTHVDSLGSLSQEQWDEFIDIVGKLEKAYKKAFGAEPLNWGCYMNHAFRSEPFNPHVHWHIFPRYSKPVEIGGTFFEDSGFGEMYDTDSKRIISDELAEQIATKLKANL